jgi:hypothetical protein
MPDANSKSAAGVIIQMPLPEVRHGAGGSIITKLLCTYTIIFLHQDKSLRDHWPRPGLFAVVSQWR